MDDCQNVDLVERYVAGDCSAQEQRAVELHAAQCTECQERLRSAQANKTVHERPDSASPHQSNAGDFTKTLPVRPDEPNDRPTTGRSTAPSEARIPDEALGSMFQGYRIVRELPRGGQAIVYEAIQKATKMKVALKVLLPGLIGSAKARRHFEQEVELAASLHHPNIVAIHDSGITQGQYYFSMEYIHGEPLDRYVDLHHMSLRDKLTLFSKICDAMTHAHQRGVIHRDLKPSNILVDERSEPHILDFGLAKTGASLHAGSENTIIPTITGQLKGTVDYMSPEQAAGRPDLIDVRSDVYSLGVILYKIITGRFPYDVSGSAFEVLHKIQHEEPHRPRQIISRFDSDVEAILLRALTKDPNQRYQSAAELRHDIQCWLDGFPIVAKSVSSLYVLRKIVARHRYTSTVVGLLLIIVVCFSYVSYYLLGVARNAQKEAEQIAAQWHNAAVQAFSSARQANLLTFLEQWHQGDYKSAALFASLLSKGSKEKRVADLLLHQDLTTENEDAFRKRFSDIPSWLVEFAIGECHLRNGYRKQALEAYQRSHQAIKQLPEGAQPVLDGLLHGQVEVRLYQLTVAREPVSSIFTRPQVE